MRRYHLSLLYILLVLLSIMMLHILAKPSLAESDSDRLQGIELSPLVSKNPLLQEYHKARVAYYNRDYSTAIVHYNKCVKIDPGFVLAIWGLGDCKLKLMQKESAKGYYQQAISIQLRYLKERKDQLGLGPTFQELVDLAYYYTRLGLLRQAEKMLQKATNMGASADSYLCMAFIEIKKKKLIKANQHFCLAWKMDPENVRLRDFREEYTQFNPENCMMQPIKK